MSEDPSQFQDYGFEVLNDSFLSSNSLQKLTFCSENQYLNQFFENGVLSGSKQDKSNLSQTHSHLDKFETDSKLPVQERCSKMKSRLHNYQKHLIITLRKTVTLEKSFYDKGNKAIHELWSTFCNSQIYNKSLLRVLFGEKRIQLQVNKKLFQKEGFKQLVDKYSSDELMDAQIVLKGVILKHFEDFTIEQLLESRKLSGKTKDLLKKYTSQFICELKEGSLTKRIPKVRKREILKEVHNKESQKEMKE